MPIINVVEFCLVVHDQRVKMNDMILWEVTLVGNLVCQQYTD